MKSFYLTTPLYYVNDAPHIGHAYTTLLGDVINRYHKLLGFDCFLMTGTDEHGQKVQQAAAKRNVSPQQHVDEYNLHFKELWTQLGVKYDKFIRTTDEAHKAYVRQSLIKLWDKGEIYSKDYSGWYSVSEERFFDESELVDGKDPIGGKAVEWLEEKNYFFKMSAYQERLIQYLEENPEFIVPDFRKNEVLGFLRQPLQDLCISRPKSRLEWGIPLPFDEDYVTYVWFDALLNYVSGVVDKTSTEGEARWPADYHLIGKDILTTHSVYWTTMLMALEIPLPKHILAHGWWLNGGAKMSKSSGTAINPIPYIEAFGVDSFRYYVMRDMVLGQDASFTDEAYFRRLNSDLSNDLGNGLNRVTKLILTHCEGRIPEAKLWEAHDEDLKTLAQQTVAKVLDMMESIKISQGIEEIMGLVRAVNKYLEIRAPWKLVKNPDLLPVFHTTLCAAAEALRLAFTLLEPIMPEKVAAGLAMLGTTFGGKESLVWNPNEGAELKPGPQQGLFPRILVEKEKPAPSPAVEVTSPAQLLELRVVEITQVEEHPEAEALYILQVNLGNEQRQVCAGLRKSLAPTDLLNKKAVLLANLKPAKLRGQISQGMLLAGEISEGRLTLANPSEIAVGSLLSAGDLKAAPKSQIKITDFDKVPLQVKEGKVYFEDQLIGFEGKPLLCAAPDGAEVR